MKVRDYRESKKNEEFFRLQGRGVQSGNCRKLTRGRLKQIIHLKDASGNYNGKTKLINHKGRRFE